MDLSLEKKLENHSTNQNPYRKTSPRNNFEQAQSVLPGYRFIRQLGHGSQGDVYLAVRASDGLQVAIKKLNISSVSNWKEYELFHREAEVLSGLNIEGVAKFYDAIERLEDEPPCSYLIQEYVQGMPLSKILNSGHRFTIDQVYDIMMQLIDILYQLHKHEPPVIHRDIKPSNILMMPLDNGKYKVYLIDFGAVANPQVQGGGSTVAGTFGYMSPEQLMGKPEAASDIYSLGALGVQMFTGKSPADFETKDFHLIFEPEMQSYPVALVNTLRSMLEPDPKKRLSDHKKLYRLFKAFQNDVYSNTGSRQSNMSPEEFQDKLLNVNAYGDDGNLELWQELSDELPRKNIPSVYLSINEYKMRTANYHLERNPVFTATSMRTNEFVQNRKNQEHWETLLTLLLLAFYAIAPILVIFLLIAYFPGVNFAKFMMPGIFVYVVILVGTHKYISRLVNKISRKLSTKLIKHDNPLVLTGDIWDVHQNYINELLEHGRKTIATIVSVEYIPVKVKMVEQNLARSFYASKDLYTFYCVHRSPLFKISYKFNPPDDEKEEDLVHEIYTHIEPENHYHPGDPLPILYRIYKNDENYEVVDSMPFPIPLNDVFLDNNVFYHLDNEAISTQHLNAEMSKKFHSIRQKAKNDHAMKELQKSLEKELSNDSYDDSFEVISTLLNSGKYG